MSVAWKFGSFDGDPLVWLAGTARVFDDGVWKSPDPSWVNEARVLTPEAFSTKFGALDLPAIPPPLIAFLQSEGNAAKTGA